MKSWISQKGLLVATLSHSTIGNTATATITRTVTVDSTFTISVVHCTSESGDTRCAPFSTTTHTATLLSPIPTNPTSTFICPNRALACEVQNGQTVQIGVWSTDYTAKPSQTSVADNVPYTCSNDAAYACENQPGGTKTVGPWFPTVSQAKPSAISTTSAISTVLLTSVYSVSAPPLTSNTEPPLTSSAEQPSISSGPSTKPVESLGITSLEIPMVLRLFHLKVFRAIASAQMKVLGTQYPPCRRFVSNEGSPSRVVNHVRSAITSTAKVAATCSTVRTKVNQSTVIVKSAYITSLTSPAIERPYSYTSLSYVGNIVSTVSQDHSTTTWGPLFTPSLMTSSATPPPISTSSVSAVPPPSTITIIIKTSGSSRKMPTTMMLLFTLLAAMVSAIGPESLTTTTISATGPFLTLPLTFHKPTSCPTIFGVYGGAICTEWTTSSSSSISETFTLAASEPTNGSVSMTASSSSANSTPVPSSSVANSSPSSSEGAARSTTVPQTGSSNTVSSGSASPATSSGSQASSSASSFQSTGSQDATSHSSNASKSTRTSTPVVLNSPTSFSTNAPAQTQTSGAVRNIRGPQFMSSFYSLFSFLSAFTVSVTTATDTTTYSGASEFSTTSILNGITSTIPGSSQSFLNSLSSTAIPSTFCVVEPIYPPVYGPCSELVSTANSIVTIDSSTISAYISPFSTFPSMSSFASSPTNAPLCPNEIGDTAGSCLSTSYATVASTTSSNVTAVTGTTTKPSSTMVTFSTSFSITTSKSKAVSSNDLSL